MKYKIISSVTLVIIILLGLLGTTTKPTFAIEEESIKTVLTVSPMNQRIILTPGEKYQSVIKITNPGVSTQELDYEVSVASFSQVNGNGSVDDYGDMNYETKTTYNQIMDWITFDRVSGHVGIGNTDEFLYTIDVPIDAPAGGQYATIMIEDTTPRESSTGNGFTIQDNVRVAYIIYAEVTGVTRNEGIIAENNIPSFLLNNELEATSMVQNNGNVHTDASYVLQVWPLGSDEEICTNEENAATELVMPETIRYHAEACQLPSVGIFKARQTVKIFGEESIVEKTVIKCPIWLLFLILFAIAAIIIYFIVRMRSRNGSKARREHAEVE